MTDLIEPATSRSAPHVETPIAMHRPNDNRYLAGNMAPVEHEVTAFDLPVTGQIPAELEGRWLRNGPNPNGGPDAPAAHWFLGSGMVHGVRLRGGKAEWYRNRYVVPGGEVARTPTSVDSQERRGRWSRPARRPSRCPTNSTRSA